jgi:hypothetical protein
MLKRHGLQLWRFFYYTLIPQTPSPKGRRGVLFQKIRLSLQGR